MDNAPLSPEADAIAEILTRLKAIESLLGERNARAGDLVDAAYVARRTGLNEKSVREGKAGTGAIPVVMLGRLRRYRRSEVDKFVEKLVRTAAENETPARVRRFLLRRKRVA